jgi:anti-sigma factor RsiW
MTTTTRFDELLPFYVNGTLSEADRSWVAGWLREHPKAAAEVEACRALQTRVREDVPAVSSEVGLERTLARIRRDNPAQAQRRRAAEPGLLEKIGGWLAALLPQPVLKPALAAALAVVAVQGLVIVQMAGQNDDTSLIRAVPPVQPGEAASYLKVNFKGEARESEIRLLLVEVSGSLAAGPGQLGDYYVRVAPAQADAAATKLQASTIVDAVARVDGLPAKP